MTAKGYLNQVRLADRQINVKLEELSKLRQKIAQRSAQLQKDKVVSSGVVDFTKTIDKIVDLEREIDSEIDALVELKRETRAKINTLNDKRYVIVLTEYYINGKTFEQISADNYWSDRHVRRLHRWALEEFGKIFELN